MIKTGKESVYRMPKGAFIDVEAEPVVIHCILELRIEKDFCHGRVKTHDGGRVLFDEYVSTLGLIATLRGNTQKPVMTCSCTIPECAGFHNQESRLSDTYVHWSLWYNGEDLDLLFNRETYETDALSILRYFHDHPWNCSEYGTVPGEYADYGDFLATIEDLLNYCPKLNDKWKSRMT